MFHATGIALGLFVLNAAASAQGFALLDATAARLPIPQIENDGVRACAGDVDGDGDLDILVVNGVHSADSIPPGDFLLQINDGAGHFVNEASNRLPSSAFGTTVGAAALMFDADGDGDLDIFVANGSTSTTFLPSGYPGFQNRMWINTGSGVFVDETASRLPVRFDSSFHAAYGDVDGDGDMDILVGNVSWGGIGEEDRLLINNGSGLFAERALPYSAHNTEAVSLVDLDGDLDLDIVSTSFSHGSVIFINDGAANYQDATATRWPAFSSANGTGMLTSDMDGDGWPDIVIANHQWPVTEGWIRIYHNDGTGHFPTWQEVSSGRAHGICAADIDNDGDQDLLASLTDEPGDIPQLRLLLNLGSGSFQNVSNATLPLIAPGTEVRYPLFVDVDSDGDPDLYLPTMQYNKNDRLLINSTVVQVAIDVKPGSSENTINLGSMGVTQVAILGSASFDATQVNPLTVRLADAAVRVRGNGTPQTTIQDVNGDSILDLVLHMETAGLQLTAADVVATLTGATYGGHPIAGSDHVRVVP